VSTDPVELDCRGLRCPAPVIRLAKLSATLPSGTTVEVACDDPAALTDVPAWCRLRGQEYAGRRDAEDGVAVLSVRLA
jgi:tRNA 2-thiouridine synthesizing protein A